MNASVKLGFKTKDTHTKEPTLFLKWLNGLNPELKSEGWRFIPLHTLHEKHSIKWIFEVDQAGAETLSRQTMVPTWAWAGGSSKF